MSVRIEFSTAGETFDDSVSPGSFWYETSQVLDQVTRGLDSGLDYGLLKDSVGNIVGSWSYIEEV